mmetsp:Transcript_83952/g.213726  ORF Transcript_83952/g.213726 Transcript_83952/m.213726 type:complete len:225 (-) Transcript_83952:288-962(-)
MFNPLSDDLELLGDLADAGPLQQLERFRQRRGARIVADHHRRRALVPTVANRDKVARFAFAQVRALRDAREAHLLPARRIRETLRLENRPGADHGDLSELVQELWQELGARALHPAVYGIGDDEHVATSSGGLQRRRRGVGHGLQLLPVRPVHQLHQPIELLPLVRGHHSRSEVALRRQGRGREERVIPVEDEDGLPLRASDQRGAAMLPEGLAPEGQHLRLRQ